MTDDRRRHSPAAARNREPILAVLREVIPERARVLEVASGTGEHAAFFTAAMPGWEWQPSEAQAPALASIEHWRRHGGDGLLAPLTLDVTATWPVTGPLDAIVAINLIHIAPWEVTEALMAGAGRLLTDDGVLVLYGPYRENGAHTAASNAAFDADLRARDPRWGVRDLETVAESAAAHGLTLEQRHAMPANNLTVVFRRSGSGGPTRG
ncbi:DUF938 domain-containing protein [Arhodomonas aquaeolei]|uniref:DUF938 domain-containing protein n=1 Tax=Arhodomonas aquaeolei TaxID=2369 RepID=UPI0003788C24|nr:DUF938 domain-containing protein [Arhodomonas aquaeolei]